jgi:molybdate transport system substrate-binding protein
MRRLALNLALGLGIGGIGGVPASATEITVLSAGAMRSVVQALAAPFESASGNHVALTFGTAGEVGKRVAARDVFDVAVATKVRLQILEATGTLVSGSIVVIGRSPIALAVRQGAAKPDISSVEAFEKAMLAASSIAYTDPASGGTSGIHLAQVLERLGLAAELTPKIRRITGSAGHPPSVGDAVAGGKAEIGMQPISELMTSAGIDIVGPLPADLQSPDLVYVAGVTAASKEPQAAKALVDFLTGPAAVPVVKAKGLEPP